jgi:hypothetical protein
MVTSETRKCDVDGEVANVIGTLHFYIQVRCVAYTSDDVKTFNWHAVAVEMKRLQQSP